MNLSLATNLAVVAGTKTVPTNLSRELDSGDLVVTVTGGGIKQPARFFFKLCWLFIQPLATIWSISPGRGACRKSAAWNSIYHPRPSKVVLLMVAVPFFLNVPSEVCLSDSVARKILLRLQSADTIHEKHILSILPFLYF